MAHLAFPSYFSCASAGRDHTRSKTRVSDVDMSVFGRDWWYKNKITSCLHRLLINFKMNDSFWLALEHCQRITTVCCKMKSQISVFLSLNVTIRTNRQFVLSPVSLSSRDQEAARSHGKIGHCEQSRVHHIHKSVQNWHLLTGAEYNSCIVKVILLWSLFS